MKNFNIYHQVANMHCKHIDSGFLSTLGITFLTIMYEAIDKDKDSVLIVKTNNEKVIGYVAGTSGLGNIYLNLLKKPFSLFMALAPSLFSYTKIKKIIEILLINKKNYLYIPQT